MVWKPTYMLCCLRSQCGLLTVLSGSKVGVPWRVERNCGCNHRRGQARWSFDPKTWGNIQEVLSGNSHRSSPSWCNVSLQLCTKVRFPKWLVNVTINCHVYGSKKIFSSCFLEKAWLRLESTQAHIRCKEREKVKCHCDNSVCGNAAGQADRDKTSLTLLQQADWNCSKTKILTV